MMGKKKNHLQYLPEIIGIFFQTAQFVLKHEDIFRMPKTFGQK